MKNLTEVLINYPDLVKFKFALVALTDVERSFSSYKWILDEKRNRLKEENIEKIMIIYFNTPKSNEHII